MKYDLTEASLLKTINECRVRPIKEPYEDRARVLGSFDQRMAYAPRNKFFASEAAQRANMDRRVAFLHVLDKRAKASGIFVITDEFVKDFIERND